MRTWIPLFLTFVAGVLMMSDFFIPHDGFKDVVAEMRQWGLIVVAFTYALGVANVAQIHGGRIGRRQRDWPYSVVLVVSMGGMAALGIFHSDAAGSPFIWLYDHVYDPLSSTMFSLLAFFITSAAYRAFRARSTEAALLLIAAVLVMLGQVPVGAAIWGGPDAFLGGFPGIKDWIMSVPNMAAKRAILMGAALGAVSTGIRVILGIERAHLGGGR
jgi:hypothetical protein